MRTDQDVLAPGAASLARPGAIDSTAPPVTAPPDRVPLVLALSGALGFWFGLTAFPMWQVAIETAQVVAGLVPYPSDNPFYLYHTRLWTVLHQIVAALLRLGVSEIALSKLLSGVLGMVSFQALAVVAYAFSRRVLFAVAVAFVVFFSRATEFGVAYPIVLLGTVHTYGVIGLSTVVLAVGLLAAGRYGMGGFLVGFAPAIHPALGVWLGVIIALVLAVRPKAAGAELRPALPGFLAGCALTIASLLLHVMFTADVPSVDPSITRPYFSAFVSFWDGHRLPMEFPRPGVRVNAGTIVLASSWLLLFPRDLPRASLFFLRFAMASACLGLGAIFLSWIPPDRLPMTLVILMPLRVLNIDVFAFPALLLGVIGAYRHAVWGLALAFALLGALVLNDISMLWNILPAEMTSAPVGRTGPLRPMAAIGLVLLACVTVSRWQAWRGAAAVRLWRGARMPAIVPVALRVLPIALIGLLIVYSIRALQTPGFEFRDRTNTPFFADLAAGEGVLLTGGDMYLVQLLTRRPVLLNGGALDTVVYTPESVPAANRILLDVYGLDLLNPPEEARGRGSIPPVGNRATWQGYSPSKWQEIRRTYDVADVLTPGDWELALPLTAAGEGMRLYRIPD